MSRRIAMVIAWLSLSVIGCASVATEKLPDPRGTIIPVADVPEGVLRVFRRHHSGESLHSVERIGVGDGTLYRFELDSGSIHRYKADGEYRGGII